MSKQNMIKREIQSDIDEINLELKNHNITFEELKKLHMKIDGKYQSKIKNWGLSCYNWNPNYGFDYEFIDNSSLIHNLTNMQSKLEGYLQDFDLLLFSTQANKGMTSIIYNNNKNENDIKIQNTIDFNIIISNINNMESLNKEETTEAIEKVKELEKIYKSNDTRKNKWEKAKKIGIWIFDKSVDVAIQLLPIFLNILKSN